MRSTVSALAVGVTVGAAAVGGTGAAAAEAPLVFPGMAIRQDASLCTLGFVDPVLRIAYTAGHCRGSGPVFDTAGDLIGAGALYRDTERDGDVIEPDDLVADYQVIALAEGVAVSDVLPGGLRLVSDPTVALAAGMPVCHVGISTGQSCGVVDSVNNGWFTMSGGVVSRKGDSGGPVWVDTGGGRAVIVGMFNSTWGTYPAAVSWRAVNDQVRADAPGAIAALGPTPTAPAPPAPPPIASAPPGAPPFPTPSPSPSPTPSPSPSPTTDAPATALPVQTQPA